MDEEKREKKSTVSMKTFNKLYFSKDFHADVDNEGLYKVYHLYYLS